LALDCSSESAAAGVYEHGLCLAEGFLDNGLTHSQTLAPLIGRVLSDAKTAPRDIGRVAVTNGPGSFTGVRVGVAAALGFAAAYGAEYAGVSSLLAAAQSYAGCEGVIAAMQDARRGRVFAALFRAGGGTLARLTEDANMTPAEAEALAAGALARAARVYSRGVYLACLRGGATPPGVVEYIRPSQAERRRDSKRNA
jgi:tRNA threonylcarbamoyladenosine biosynthesis protein TsaB